MKMKLQKLGVVAVLIIVLVTSLTMTSSAYVAFNSYNFNYYGEAVETPSGYTPERVLYGPDFGIDELTSPTDVYVSPQNEVYILDHYGSENEVRLHILDENFKLITTLSTLKANGHDYRMNVPEGIVVDDEGYIYICDTGNRQILKLAPDKSGRIVQTIGAPDSDLFSGDFQPIKIAIAKNKSLYVISQGCLDGIMEFDVNGTFLRYFGAPDVKLSLSDMVTLAWRRVYRALVGARIDSSFITFVPTEFANLVVDEYGFVYSVVAAAGNENTDQLFKMNFLGNNILDPTAKSTKKISNTLSRTYGDLVRRVTGNYGNIFQDVAVDDDGFITMLDSNLCKVFEYDSEGNMTFVYGAMGEQEGLFSKPCAVAKLGKKTLVLDSYFGSLTVFAQTDYGETLHQGIDLYNQGLYMDAEEYWDNVLKRNANCELALIGLGKVYYQYERYEEALNFFRLANDRTNYKDTFSLYRESVISDYFNLVMTLLLIVIVLIILWRIFGKTIIRTIKERKQGGGDRDDTETVE